MRNLALVWVLAGGLMGCGMGKSSIKSAPPPSISTFTDKRDGRVYKIVKIGSQVWFAENLNYAAEGSVCYDNKEENCAKYGRLYNWKTALTACPAGTHLPTDKEWTTLTDYAGGEKKAGTKLKSSTSWKSDEEVPAGTNEYGFSAFPGGFGNGVDDFKLADNRSFWWTETEKDHIIAWYRGMDCYHEYVDRDGNYKPRKFSVRCVLDDEKEKQK